MKETVFGGNIMWSKIRLCSHNTLRPFKPARKPGGASLLFTNKNGYFGAIVL